MGGKNRPTSELMAELRADWGGRCEECGRTYDLEFAHIRPNGLKGEGRGSRQRYYNIRKNPQDYRLLCRLCHHDFDYPPKEKTDGYQDTVPF